MSKVNTSNQLNILAAREMLGGHSLEQFNKQVRAESSFFNQLKGEGKTNYHRHPTRAQSGKWYIEQLVRNTNGTFSTVKVLVNKIKSGKFVERDASKNHRRSFSEQMNLILSPF